VCRPRPASHAHFRHWHTYGLNSSINTHFIYHTHDNQVQHVLSIRIWCDGQWGGAQNYMKLFVAPKMTQNNTMNTVHVAATELPQLQSQNTNTCMFVEETAQRCCQNLCSCKINWKNWIVVSRGGTCPTATTTATANVTAAATTTLWVEKTRHYNIVHNFAKCLPIFNFFHWQIQ